MVLRVRRCPLSTVVDRSAALAACHAGGRRFSDTLPPLDKICVQRPVEALVAATAATDGHGVEIVLEQEPAAAGKSVVERYKRHVLYGYNVRSVRATGPKEIRPRVVAAAAENGLIKIVHHKHSNALLDELAAFPNGAHDDCVDALAGAYEALARRSGPARISVPTGNVYELAELARRHSGQPRRRSAAIANQQLDRERESSPRIAAELGLHYYDSRRGSL